MFLLLISLQISLQRFCQDPGFCIYATLSCRENSSPVVCNPVLAWGGCQVTYPNQASHRTHTRRTQDAHTTATISLDYNYTFTPWVRHPLLVAYNPRGIPEDVFMMTQRWRGHYMTVYRLDRSFLDSSACCTSISTVHILPLI